MVIKGIKEQSVANINLDKKEIAADNNKNAPHGFTSSNPNFLWNPHDKTNKNSEDKTNNKKESKKEFLFLFCL